MEHKEEVKQYEKLASFHETRAQELEAQIADVRAIKNEARRHRREMAAALKKAMAYDGPSVVIVRGPCPQNVRIAGEPLVVDTDRCNGCKICLRVGCPAVTWRDDKVFIEPTLCIGETCQLCHEACPRDAIHLGREEATVGNS